MTVLFRTGYEGAAQPCFQFCPLATHQFSPVLIVHLCLLFGAINKTGKLWTRHINTELNLAIKLRAEGSCRFSLGSSLRIVFPCFYTSLLHHIFPYFDVFCCFDRMQIENPSLTYAASTDMTAPDMTAWCQHGAHRRTLISSQCKHQNSSGQLAGDRRSPPVHASTVWSNIFVHTWIFSHSVLFIYLFSWQHVLRRVFLCMWECFWIILFDQRGKEP